MFSRSAHLPIQLKQKVWAQPLILDSSSLDGLHMQMAQEAIASSALSPSLFSQSGSVSFLAFGGGFLAEVRRFLDGGDLRDEAILESPGDVLTDATEGLLREELSEEGVSTTGAEDGDSESEGEGDSRVLLASRQDLREGSSLFSSLAVLVLVFVRVFTATRVIPELISGL